MKYLLTIFLTIIALLNVVAQNGTIQGTVLDLESQEPVFGANVILDGTTIGTATDFDGKFNISAKSGVYDLKISYLGYNQFSMVDLEVAPGEEITLSVHLQSEEVGLNEVVVQAKAERATSQSLTIERRNTNLMVQNIGAEELSNVGAGDAASGLKKVVGLSVVGSKYIYVRGLGDRYNSATLNGLPISSPDPDKRVVPFDIFSTSIIESINVVKAYHPRFYGDFSGGSVEIRTKNYPDTKTFTFSYGVGLNTLSTFRNFQYNNAQSKDFLGFKSSYRDVPENIPAYDGQRLYDSRSNSFSPGFQDTWNPLQRKAPLNQSFELSFGNMLKLGNESEIGYLVNANYDQKYGYRDGKFKFIRVDGNPLYDFDFVSSVFSTSKAALGSFYYKINNRNTISFNTLQSHLSADEARETKGYHWDYVDDLFTRRFTYRDYLLQSYQLVGEHRLSNDKITLEYKVGKSNAASNEPDRRELVWFYNKSNEESQMYGFNTIDTRNNARFFSEMQDDALTGAVELSYALREDFLSEGFIPKINLGFNYLDKTRNFGSRLFAYNLDRLNFSNNRAMDINDPDRYLREDNLLTPLRPETDDSYFIAESTLNTDFYDADMKVYAGYAAADLELVPGKLSTTFGLRIEKSVQGINYRTPTILDTQPQLRTELDDLFLLPMLNLKYDVSDNANFRFNASKTISRPDFKELPLFQYLEVFAGVATRGNPILKNGSVYNLDLRYEKYFRPGELIAIGGFGKLLEDPIESVFLAVGSGALKTYANTERAYLYGVEMEVRKRLDFISDKLMDFTLNGNVTLLQSEVTIGDPKVVPRAGNGEVSVILTNDKRPMVGASPYLVNLDLMYEKITEKISTTATLAYNVYGKRILTAGSKPQNASEGLGDIYEMPINTLNFTLKTNFLRLPKLDLNVSALNLLNPTIRTVQESPDIGEVDLNSYKLGSNYNIGLTYRLY